MAFKASRKSPVKKTAKIKPEEQLLDASDAPDAPPPVPFSIDDLIGAPVTSPSVIVPTQEEIKSIAPEKSAEQIISTPSQDQSATYSRSPQNRIDQPYKAQRGYDRGPQSQNGGQNRGYQGGYRRGGSTYGGASRYGSQDANQGNPGRYQPRSYGSDPAGRGGYRREWGNPQAAPVIHEQDINVPTETVKGILDIMPEGHGFLRPKFTPSDRDVYISQSQIRRFMLRNGDMVEGQARQPKDNERYWGLLKVEKVDDKAAEEMAQRARFEDLTPIYPNKFLRLETGMTPLSTRIIDLVAPIGFGQRGLVVSPPKAGKTTILKEIAAGIAANYPDVHLMAALIGERPEEVTDLSRSIKGEVLASNFDESPAEQTRIAEVALDRAKRLVEMGKDVVVLLDSITRLARAYNMVVNPSGRTLSGGFDPAALYPAKKFLGAARCVELTAPLLNGGVQATGTEGVLGEQNTPAGQTAATTGGSLTVIGTALVDTGSRMDDMIYEEFKGTGNMELHLSRALQERRVFPAIDIAKSGTRHDELLLGEEKMKKVTTLRHMLSLLGDEERTMMLTDKLSKTKSNDEFLESLSQG